MALFDGAEELVSQIFKEDETMKMENELATYHTKGLQLKSKIQKGLALVESTLFAFKYLISHIQYYSLAIFSASKFGIHS